MIEATRVYARRHLPGVEVIPRKLEQGPPVDAPVEIRLMGNDLKDLHQAATLVAEALRRISGTLDVRHDMSPGAPSLSFRIDDAAAARNGLSRVHVAQALFGHTRGLVVGEMHGAEDPIPVVVRSSAGEHTVSDDLIALGVARADRADRSTASPRTVPLGQVAQIETEWLPAAIKHRDRQRVVTVSSQLAEGSTFSDVINAFSSSLPLPLPEGVSLHFGGDLEGSGEANAAMVASLPIGLILLLGILLAEFNSFRRVTIILVTVPLAAAGVIPGLLFGGQPFGFMSMLGVIALVGIVVNNAIVLLEVVESKRRSGAPIVDALQEAVVTRIRPILLTSATTVAGLLPLALSPSTLWPPLASAMISGLLASTLLTLLVVPAMYRVLFREPAAQAQTSHHSVQRIAGVALACLLLTPSDALGADDLTLQDALRRALQHPAARAADASSEAAAQNALAERRLAYMPQFGTSVQASGRNRDLVIPTPIGDLSLDATTSRAAGVEWIQPIFNPARSLFANPASRRETEAAQFEALREHQHLAMEAGLAHLALLDLDAQLEATAAYVASLEGRLREVQAMVSAGRALAADAIKIQLALEQAQLEHLALEQVRAVARADYARVVGLNLAHALPVGSWMNRRVPEIDDITRMALEQRPDLRAQAKQHEALELRRKQVRAEALPQLEAKATWSWTDGSPYQVDHWGEAALTVRWHPFAAGTRAPRSRALAAQCRATESQIEELNGIVLVQIQSALAALETARHRVAVRQRGVEMAVENLRVEQVRHRSGRTTTNDLLEAESELRAQRTQFDQAHLQVVRAWLDLWWAVGVGDLTSLFEE